MKDYANPLTNLTPVPRPICGSALTSQSVNDCRLKATQKPKIRVPNNVRITGGYCDGATAEISRERVTLTGDRAFSADFKAQARAAKKARKGKPLGLLARDGATL